MPSVLRSCAGQCAARQVAPALAAGLPFLLYVASISAHSYWLDSGEFTAASLWLDIPHPPGHPLACLWGKLFCLLPCGPLPFRVALGQAVAAALALLCLFDGIARSVARIGVAPGAGAGIALGATWLVGGSSAFVFQAARAEVYAVQALMVCFALSQLVVLACRDDADDGRPLYRAALALGLALANHHFVAILALPALFYELGRLTRRRGPAPWGWGTLAGLVGLSTYVYLPMRALREPPLDLGHPATLANLGWVISARVFAHNIGSEAVQPLRERLADLTVLMVENLGMLALALALLGVYALLRARRTWSLAYLWAVTAALSLLMRAWLNPVRANPDVLGYMMPGFAALAALAACGYAALLVVVQRAARGALLGWIAIALPVVLGLAQLSAGSHQRALARFRATAAFDLRREVDLPAHTLLIATTPTLAFRFWDAAAVETVRPDVAMLPMPFLNYPDKARLLVEARGATPAFAALVRAAAGRDALPLAALLAVARERPVRIELDARVALPLLPNLLPDGLLHRVLPSAPSRPALERAMAARERALEALTDELAGELADRETMRQLLWMHYVDGLYLAHHGARALALRAVARGLALQPAAPELQALHAALAGSVDGVALDVRPFVAAGSRD